MADISITPGEPREFEVTVRDSGGETSHHVSVPPEVSDELGVSEDDLERLVRESFEFLLEREPASSIMSEFSLDVITRYFPEYPDEIRGRL